jgi:hypothetical protein
VKFLSADDQKAEVAVDYEDLGRVDTWLRFSFPSARPARVTVKYHLVRQSDLSPPRWKIEAPQPSAWASLDAAIKYVNEMRAKAADPVIREHADKTLDTLKHLSAL